VIDEIEEPSRDHEDEEEPPAKEPSKSEPAEVISDMNKDLPESSGGIDETLSTSVADYSIMVGKDGKKKKMKKKKKKKKKGGLNDSSVLLTDIQEVSAPLEAIQEEQKEEEAKVQRDKHLDTINEDVTGEETVLMANLTVVKNNENQDQSQSIL